jgi:hypothetical protein
LPQAAPASPSLHRKARSVWTQPAGLPLGVPTDPPGRTRRRAKARSAIWTHQANGRAIVHVQYRTGRGSRSVRPRLGRLEHPPTSAHLRPADRVGTVPDAMLPTGIRDSVNDDIVISSSPEEVGSDGKHIRGRRVSREQPCNCERSSRSTAQMHQGQAAPLGAAFFHLRGFRADPVGQGRRPASPDDGMDGARWENSETCLPVEVPPAADATGQSATPGTYKPAGKYPIHISREMASRF